MAIRNSYDSFGSFGLFIHWAMAVLMVAGFVSGQIMEDVPRGAEKLSIMGWHMLVGGVIFALILIRVLWRRMDPPPTLPDTMPAWEVKLSWIAHMALYGVMIALPVTGFLAVTSIDVSVPLPGLFEVGPLLLSKPLHEGAEEIHELLVGLMVASVVLHIIGALWHRYVSKDGVTERMIPFLKRA
ncbi:MAG: cytochrome b [Rhodospirillales bacterium]|nr:cytochrome b [Rhodospirillales bacterium]